MSDDGAISLCLSGGGFRAAVFHLGALRWLNECGILPRLVTISCVSGGSIVGAHLAYRFRDRWPTAPVPTPAWNDDIVELFWNCVNQDLRTWPVVVRFLSPFNWFRPPTTVAALIKQYVTYLLEGHDIPLSDLQEMPRFVFCATDMVFGVNWEASHQRVGDFEAGYSQPPETHWTLARAVAASSCFPPVFPPAMTHLGPHQLTGGDYQEPDRDRKIRQIRLTDGGVYDNLGLQPVNRDTNVLVSDGGGAMQFSLVNLPWRRLARYPALLQNAIGKLRKSALMRDYNAEVKSGAYWGIAAGPERGGVFPTKEQAQSIAEIRTDLNRFTRAEFEILENHGYLAAAERTTAKCPHFLRGSTPLSSVVPPYPQCWLDSPGYRRALKYSSRRFVPYSLR